MFHHLDTNPSIIRRLKLLPRLLARPISAIPEVKLQMGEQLMDLR